MNELLTTTSSDGTTIAYRQTGSGPALIMVDAAGNFHGFRPLGPLDEHVAGQFTVITYDRRGRGDSTDTLPYAVDREVDDLQALIDVAGGSAFVFGFSSGAVLALHAAARGLAITKLALLEPPLDFDAEQSEPGSDLGAEVAELVAAGRRGDAFEHFNTSIGVPAEMIAGLRDAPFWPALEALAHTLVYDLTITGSLPIERLSTITTPALVVNSAGSDDSLLASGRGVAQALPNADHRVLQGEWHGVPLELLAPEIAEFFTGTND